MTVTISPATEEEIQSGEIGRRLREFNYTYVGEYPATEYIRLNAREFDGSVVGGIRAFVALYWLRVEVLWVDEAARGRGIGSRLLAEAERLAREMGARKRGTRDLRVAGTAVLRKAWLRGGGPAGGLRQRLLSRALMKKAL